MPSKILMRVPPPTRSGTVIPTASARERAHVVHRAGHAHHGGALLQFAHLPRRIAAHNGKAHVGKVLPHERQDFLREEEGSVNVRHPVHRAKEHRRAGFARLCGWRREFEVNAGRHVTEDFLQSKFLAEESAIVRRY
jgi:hypothetical protein